MKRVGFFLAMNIRPKYLFFLYLTLAAIFLIPIISANTYFADDLLRTSTGTYNWMIVGRPVAEYIMNILSFTVGEPYPDLGQLTQILAIPLLALAAFFFVLNQYATITTKEMLIGSFIIINPFLLENLSYRFDAFFMVLGYLLSIVAATLPLRLGVSKVVLMSIAMYTTAFLMYQPIIFVAIPVIFYQFYRNMNTGRETSKLLSTKVFYRLALLGTATLVGVVAIKLFIPEAERSSIIPFNSSFIPEVVQSIVQAVGIIYQYVSEAAWIYAPALVMALLGYLTLVYIYVRSYTFEDIWFWCTLAVLLASPFLIVFMVVGPMILLQSQFLSWRVISVFGVWLSIAVFLISVFMKHFFGASKERSTVAIISVLIGLQIVGIGYTYGALLSRHDSFLRTRTAAIGVTLNTIGLSDRPILMTGVYGSPRSAQATLKAHPSLQHIIPYGDHWVPRFMLQELGYSVRADMKPTYTMVSSICGLNHEPMFTSKHYDIYDFGADEPVLVFSKGLPGRKPC